MNKLFYGDNLEVLRRYVDTESVDFCYCDPPFNSKRTYNQIYNNIGSEDKAQAQAFIDTWVWDTMADEGFHQILSNINHLFTKQSIELIYGFSKVLGKGSLMAYLVSMTLRIAEINRVLKPNGSFYFHCDPTASHYLKLVIDSIFLPKGGDYRNEIVWCYSRMAAKGQKQLSKCHDIIFWYSKSKEWQFYVDEVRLPYAASSKARAGYKKTNLGGGSPKSEICELNEIGKFPEDWIQIPFIRGNEYLGYQTQKPEALLERFILASSKKGDVVLDAYCGCGTSIAVAQKHGRDWIGIDITYQSISLILKRLEDTYGKQIINNIQLNGVPKDIESAFALAHKKDDRTRKEFEKWAVLTYSNNKAMINEKKGADHGIDGIAFMMEGTDIFKDILFSVKSGHPNLSQFRDFLHVVKRDNAAIGIFITMEDPTKEMISEAKKMGRYTNPLTEQIYDKVSIVTIEKILAGEKLNVPTSIQTLKKAEITKNKNQHKLFD